MLSEDIGARLEYFQELERATRMLNHPGESLVVQDDFLDMVERVDICIDFLSSHVSLQSMDIISNSVMSLSENTTKPKYTCYASDNASRAQ